MNKKISEFKKALILETAHKYFKLYGYNGTQIEKIAKELEIGIGTIYSLFGSKDGLFFSWLFSIMEKAYLEIEDKFKIEKNPLLQCEIFVRYKLTYYETNKEIFKDYMKNQFFLKDASRGEENPMKKVYAMVSKSIEAFIKENKFSNIFTKNYYHLAYVLDGIVDSYIECYTEVDENIDLATKTREVIRMFLNAIGMNEYEYKI